MPFSTTGDNRRALGRTAAGLLIAGLILFASCYFPSKHVESVTPDRILRGTPFTSPVKVFLQDGSIILFPSGFTAGESAIQGQGRRFVPGGPSAPDLELVEIPLDRVAAMTYYDERMSPGETIGSVILDVSAVPLVFFSVYCLSCPKCCFGSCPTVYTEDGGEFKLAAELFSFSVGRLAESDDLDFLAGSAGPPGRLFEMRLTNEALESHRINWLRPLAVVHPLGTRVFPDSNNRLVLFRRFLPPLEARNSLGEDVLPAVAEADDRACRSPQSLVERLKEGPFFDHLDVKLKIPPGASSVKLLLRLRNTLLSTLLFYDLVLGSQGLDALSWIQRMNGDPAYAGRFWFLFRVFSGVRVKVLTDSGWRPAGLIVDPGPLAFKRLALSIPASGREDIELRLEFVPDNYLIDSVNYDYEENPAADPAVIPLEFDDVRDMDGRPSPDVRALVADKDDRYLETEPGQAYRFFFNPPAARSEEEQVSIFIASRGFYNEWLRGKWLEPPAGSDYRFDLGDVPGTLRRLAESWLESKTFLEERFFQTRIPIRGGW